MEKHWIALILMGIMSLAIADGLRITSNDIIGEIHGPTCLAMVVYHEARNQPVKGKLAVAQVVLNRMESARFPATVCGVVTQPHQFSFAHDGKSDTPYEHLAWLEAQEIAHIMLAGAEFLPVRNALHYHATYVQPKWAEKMTVIGQFGDHVFLEER